MHPRRKRDRSIVAGVALVVVGTIAACGAREEGEVDGGLTDVEVTAQDRIDMSRGPCFGTCPIYTLAVGGDGSVRFVGERWVEATGERLVEIDPADAARLFAWADSIDFFGFPADITPSNEAACGGAATDMPSVELTIVRPGRVHTVHHYHGCLKPRESLTRFEERIDEVAGVARWVGAP